MEAIFRWTFPVLWWSWAAYWIYSASGVRPAKRTQMGIARLIHLAELVLAAVLISWGRLGEGWLGTRLWGPSEAFFLIGAATTAAGLGFAVWARVHLAEYWSGNITLKEGHRLIRTGPYRLVRHPIYTGILLGFLGSAIALGQVRGVIALAIVLEALVRKLRKEERWLTEEFGEEYLRYKREVRALL